MVYQMPLPGKARLFAASSAQSEESARLELQQWAGCHGYKIADVDRTFTVYAAEQTPRKWLLLERAGLSHTSSNTPSGTGH